MKTISYSPRQLDSKVDQLIKAVYACGRLLAAHKTQLSIFTAVALLLTFFCLVAQFSTPLNSGVTSSAAALTIIAAAAVGIERAIEMFWTYIGLTQGSWWPLGPVREQLYALTSGLNESFEPFYLETQATLKRLRQAETWGEEKLAAAARDLEKIKKHVEEIQKLPIDSQRVQLIVNSAERSVQYFSRKYPEIQGAAEIASFGIQGVTNFVETFKDNPGRRLISLFTGALAGLLIAGFTGLDIFQAVFDTPASSRQSAILPHVGVAITGVLMGLGANPTHEAIRLLQEIKNKRKTANV
jgi:hypothetical protein